MEKFANENSFQIEGAKQSLYSFIESGEINGSTLDEINASISMSFQEKLKNLTFSRQSFHISKESSVLSQIDNFSNQITLDQNENEPAIEKVYPKKWPQIFKFDYSRIKNTSLELILNDPQQRLFNRHYDQLVSIIFDQIISLNIVYPQRRHLILSVHSIVEVYPRLGLIEDPDLFNTSPSVGVSIYYYIILY
jgi:hypothetical protein